MCSAHQHMAMLRREPAGFHHEGGWPLNLVVAVVRCTRALSLVVSTTKAPFSRSAVLVRFFFIAGMGVRGVGGTPVCRFRLRCDLDVSRRADRRRVFRISHCRFLAT